MDNFCSNEACTSPWFMFIFIGSLSFNITSKLLLLLSFTMDKFGRVSLKISNTGFWSCSSLKHERSNRKSVTK
uniref:Transmembrane protein n=1 Tax=Medicago truncatula TaxID=3880 RepID=I3T7W7_MEDTR|nr:unknown [Medicago truncatula]